ncbi:MAG: hypothetical protein WD602_08015 [Actinomycetota bacterium]
MDPARNASAERLSDVAGLARPVCLADEQSLPVLTALEGLLPHGGLQRGFTVTVQGGPGTNALALSLMAGASRAGSWVAAVGMPSLGIASAAEMGVVLERLILVAAPTSGRWPKVAASLIDSFDLVLVNWPDASTGMVRRLGLRARDRRAVLISVVSAGRGQAWHEAADVCLTVTSSRWEGLGSGHGRLTARRLEVEASGRRSPMSRSSTLWLPDRSGRVAERPTRTVEPVPLRDGVFEIG